MEIVDDEAVRRVLDFDALIPAMRDALIAYSNGTFDQTPRRLMAVPGQAGYFAGMPGVSADVVGAKLVSFYPGNADAGLPTHMATIVLFDPATGRPAVLMDGHHITAMRTAAVTAAYVDHAAAAGPLALAVIGAGVQGAQHIEALSRVREFSEIRVWNRTTARAEALAAQTGARVMDREAAVRDADVVVLATGSSEPVIDGRWLRPGARVASVGWRGGEGGEADAHTMANTVVVDSRAGTLADSGNVRRFDVGIYAELGEVLAGDKPLDPEATVVFESIGMACEDLAAARLVCEGLGLVY